MPTCTLTSSSIIVPTGSPLISRMRSPTWIAFRTSGLISIPRTLRVEDFLWVHQRKRLDWWTGPTPPGTGSAGVIYYHNSTMTNPLAVIKILKRCLTDTRVIKTNNVKKKKNRIVGTSSKLLWPQTNNYTYTTCYSECLLACLRQEPKWSWGKFLCCLLGYELIV